MHSEICPVCSGSGKYNDQECHGCRGKGWIEVQNKPGVQIIPPYIPAPYYVPVPYPDSPPSAWPPRITYTTTLDESTGGKP